MSFFQKEEELLQNPKKVPDAASEVLGDAKKSDQKFEPAPRIIENRADDLGEVKKNSQLPYSSAQLKEALQKTRAPQERPSPAQSQTPQNQTPQNQTPQKTPEQKTGLAHEEVGPAPAFDEDIRAFEDAIMEVAGPDEHHEHSNAATIHNARATPLKDGFFSSFEEFLETGSLDSSHLDGDLLHKMRNFHERRDEGKEPFVHKRDAQEAVRRRLHELQVLEHEWYRRYQDARDIERGMIHLEEEIDERARSLRTLLGESSKVQLFSKEVAPDQAFVFANGERVCSLGALQRVLLRADAALYSQHVTAERNDFASWIESVLQMPKLAQEVRLAVSRTELLDLLREA